MLHLTRLTLTAACLATLAFASGASAAEPTAATPGSSNDTVSAPKWELVGGGAAVFLGSYAAAAAMGVIVTEQCMYSAGEPVAGGGGDSGCADRRPYLRLLIPIAGPFTYLSKGNSTGGNVIFVADGALQLAGVTLAVVGALWTKPAGPRAAARASWTPVVGDRSVGVAGTF
ncbi:MAG: hypothetical protein HOO96_16270 [Polyangiaceae bacterium]|nr:hypothetical protein [Polyangiaceae bacterium]